jgi:acetyl esterase/lipase
MPGGGFNYVVRDKEGSEAAEWLNTVGMTGCVLRYRTKDGSDRPLWQRPVQDGQRALSLLRARAAEWRFDSERIGLLGFSAGAQAAALVATRFDRREYDAGDEIDSASCRPDFVLLIYPWRLLNDDTGRLKDELTVTPRTPPMFLVHAHNDSATSLSSVLLYTALKQHGVSAELHIYETGGHAYGLRPVNRSSISTWPSRAEEWLRGRGILASDTP